MQTSHRSAARVLAPVALVAAVLALLLIVATAGGGNGSDTGGSASDQEQQDLGLKEGEGKRRKKDKDAGGRVSGRTYVVRTGDTLGSIAEKTGVSVEKLQELNPELDPQALVSGQKIKLRE